MGDTHVLESEDKARSADRQQDKQKSAALTS